MRRIAILLMAFVLSISMTACIGDEYVTVYHPATPDEATADEATADEATADEPAIDIKTDSETILARKAAELIGEYGIAPDETLKANSSKITDTNWTHREGIASVLFTDLDGDKINDLVVVRLIGGELKDDSENVAVSVYYCTEDGVGSAGEITLPYGDDFTEKDLDLFVYQNEIYYECDFTKTASTYTKMYYYVLGYENNTLVKRVLLESENSMGFYNKWIETLYSGNKPKSVVIYDKTFNKDTRKYDTSGQYKDSENPALDYFVNRGLPETSECFSLEKYPNFFLENGTEPLCEMVVRKKSSNYLIFLSSLTDYTDFDLDDLINQFTEEINWKELYIDKLNEIEENGNTYDLVDIDDDDIPEVVYSGVPNLGTQIIYLKGNQAELEKLTGGEFCYEPVSGRILTHHYSMTNSELPIIDTVYEYQYQTITPVFSGSKIRKKDGGLEYYLNDVFVTKDEYYSALYAEFDTEYSKAISHFYTKDEVIEMIEEYLP